MKKDCLYCGKKTNAEYKFCPECGHSLSLTVRQVWEIKAAEGDEDAKRKLEADDAFRKSVLEVAKAFFAMSPQERQDMIEYVNDRCKQAEEEYKKLN